ncbi:MAG: hypothetical protein MI861_24385, partial [Pirellulales bacterium]|nr:hypothetical protein [Pirellulales bacterium]
DWYQWNQVLPAWLGDVPSLLPSLANPIGSVAVIAAHPITAEPLMDVVASRGLAVVWCRQADPFRVRGVDAMLWDDTAATPTGVAGWRQRIADCGAPADTCVHAWFVQRPEICQYHSALQAGVRLLVSKPYDVRVFDWILADSAGGGQHSLLHQCNVGRSPKLVA